MLTQNKNNSLLNTKPRKYFFMQIAFVTAFSYLTSGVYLSGLAISVGAGDVLVSYLSVIINICGVVILVFSAFLERFHSRKRLTLWLTVLSRVATVLIVTIPAFVPQKYRLPLFVFAVIVAFTLQAQTSVVLNQWMLCFVDSKKSGRYISIRQTFALVVTVVFTLVGGWYMDSVQGQYKGFVVLFVIAAAFGLFDVLLLLKIPDAPVQERVHQPHKLRELLRLPLKNKKFRSFVFYIFAFYLLLTISDSFTMVYMMKYLELPYRTVTAMCLIISLPQVVFLGIWGKISDKYGHLFVLNCAIWLFAGETLFIIFASPQSWYVFLPIAFFIASFANAGFTVAVFNRRYELMPVGNRIAYDNFYTAAIGIGFTLGPMLGGLLKNSFQQLPDTWNSMAFAEIRLLYAVSTVGILLLQLLYFKRSRPHKDTTNAGRKGHKDETNNCKANHA